MSSQDDEPTDRQRSHALKFEHFHQQNPHIYGELVALARQMKARGETRVGIKMLWEALRWENLKVNPDATGFKLNNNLHSRYARRIMENEPDLDGFFEIRELGVGQKRVPRPTRPEMQLALDELRALVTGRPVSPELIKLGRWIAHQCE